MLGKQNSPHFNSSSYIGTSNPLESLLGQSVFSDASISQVTPDLSEILRHITSGNVGIRLLPFTPPEEQPFLKNHVNPQEALSEGEHPRKTIQPGPGVAKMKHDPAHPGKVKYVTYRGPEENALKTASQHLGINNRAVGLLSLIFLTIKINHFCKKNIIAKQVKKLVEQYHKKQDSLTRLLSAPLPATTSMLSMQRYSGGGGPGMPPIPSPDTTP